MPEVASKSHFTAAAGPLSRTWKLGSSAARAAINFRRQLWLWPLVAALLLSVVGWMLYRTVENSLRANVASQLQAILDADLAALDVWLNMQRHRAQDTASDPELAAAAEQVLPLAARDATDVEIVHAPQQAALRKMLTGTMSGRGYVGFIVSDRQGRIISSFREELIGKRISNLYPDSEFLERTLAGNATVSRPRKSASMLPDRHGRLRAGVPTMFACAPIRDAKGQVIAGLGLRIAPEVEFTKILNVARFGNTGETYAFNRDGLLLSSSRFDADLKRIGLLPDDDDAESILTVRLRDPLVDLTLGQRTPTGATRPLTHMATEAIAGRDGVNAIGYRDYRGVPVVGAWKWLPQYGFGVTTEIDRDEAYAALRILKGAFWSTFALLILTAVGMLVALLLFSRMRLALKNAAIESKRLGQYTLEEKLGEGGMGVVYKARHAFLRRPTAVKLLHPSLSSDESVRRFEREVQLTSQLCHPNTIAIYDYGRTEEGIFYYAMEYLDGMSLETLIQRYGPQPEGRVIHILQQVCGSLGEAHSRGLIHRDIKPANIVINERAGMHDVVKVLDFGLVKGINTAADPSLTATRAFVGTPHYMSPEAIMAPDQVDARSDLYAVGAVGYFLLTGQPVFDGDALMEVCNKHMHCAPEPPSRVAKQPVSQGMDTIILTCLEKERSQRPQSAQELCELLSVCATQDTWTRANAEQWWKSHSDVILARSAIAAKETAPYTETLILPERKD